jgi:hypothetical protein
MMRVVFGRLTLLAWCLGALVLAAGCGTSISGVTYEHYMVSCCQTSKANQPYQAGESLMVQWMVIPSGRTPSSAATQLDLRATLEGPYASVTGLKSGTPAAYTLHAPAITTTDRASSVPPGVIQLPADLSPGYYDLVTTVAAPDSVTSGASVVQVTG